MIRTAARQRSGIRRAGRLLPTRRTTRHPWRVWFVLFGAVLFLGACTNSKFLVSAFYNRIDNRSFAAINEWTDLTDQQNDELRAYIGTTHTWHRRTQLPVYVDLIRDMTSTLSTYDQAVPADFDRWIGKVRSSMEALRICHPVNYAVPLTRTLSTEQIDQAESHWREEREERRERFGSRTPEERIERRVGNIAKWAGRLGFDLKDSQIDMIRDTMQQQTTFGPELRELSDQWYETLFVIARQTDSPDYEQQLKAHIDDWFGMAERAYPEEWQQNRELWRDFAIRFEKTLSKIQRRDMLRWLDKFANTLDAVSRQEPDWLPADDPAYGCVVDTGTTTADKAGVDASGVQVR